MIERINLLLAEYTLVSPPIQRARQLADIFVGAMGAQFFTKPQTRRDAISGKPRLAHQLLRMLSDRSEADFALAEILEISLYLESFSSDPQIKMCLDSLRDDRLYQSTLFQLAMAFRLRSAGCEDVHLEPETERGRADVAFSFEGARYIAECYRINKGFSDYFVEAQHGLYDSLLALVPDSSTYTFTLVLGRLPTFDCFRRIVRRFHGIAEQLSTTPDLVAARYRFEEHTLGIEDITGLPEDPDLIINPDGPLSRRRYDDADSMFIREQVPSQNAFAALDVAHAQRAFRSRVFLWKNFERPRAKSPASVLLDRLNTKLKQTKPKDGSARRVLFVDFPFGLFIHARTKDSFRDVQERAVRHFSDFAAVAVMERTAGSTNRFRYEGAFLAGTKENAMPASLVDRLSTVEESDIFALQPQSRSCDGG